MEFRVLAVGDVCGISGLQWLAKTLRPLRREYGVDFCVVNGENASGVGITPQQADSILSSGNDLIMSGNQGDVDGILAGLKEGTITRADLEACAARVIAMAKRLSNEALSS